MQGTIKRARKLMHQKTLKNKAPDWSLTEIVIKKAKELCKKYKVRQDLVLISLYLSHIVFDEKIKGKIQMNHERLSVGLAKRYLDKWKVDEADQKIILNAILAHHDKIKTESLEAEIVKNAEGFKFLTIRGCLIYLHVLGGRGLSYQDAVKQVLYKMNQKFSYLTLMECIKEAGKNKKDILKLFKRQL